jgi:hypothetical protein
MAGFADSSSPPGLSDELDGFHPESSVVSGSADASAASCICFDAELKSRVFTFRDYPPIEPPNCHYLLPVFPGFDAARVRFAAGLREYEPTRGGFFLCDHRFEWTGTLDVPQATSASDSSARLRYGDRSSSSVHRRKHQEEI